MLLSRVDEPQDRPCQVHHTQRDDGLDSDAVGGADGQRVQEHRKS